MEFCWWIRPDSLAGPDWASKKTSPKPEDGGCGLILMTILTTILGLMPLALGIGEGAEAQAPLARTVVGGLTGSTLITLFLIPAVYSLFHPEKKGSDL